ncbi:hypothetical protein BJV77DRAFT_1151751 [Russula vinacea]|nr:hypothetical protein BJV77DRAFT_1151751 [Russula vinacea]
MQERNMDDLIQYAIWRDRRAIKGCRKEEPYLVCFKAQARHLDSASERDLAGVVGWGMRRVPVSWGLKDITQLSIEPGIEGIHPGLGENDATVLQMPDPVVSKDFPGLARTIALIRYWFKPHVWYHVWYPSRCWGCEPERTNFLNETCGVRVKLKALPPERRSGRRGGFVQICVEGMSRVQMGWPCSVSHQRDGYMAGRSG